MDRAYSTLELKSVGETADGKRRFTGIASTVSTDRMSDVVEPQGMKAKLPAPLLWQHDSSQPIGWVTATRVTDKSVEVDCEIATINEAGPLKDRLDTAWQSIKSKLVRGLSIGFNALESARIEGTYGYRYLSWELLELSCVTIPANGDCSITKIKSIDQQYLLVSPGNKGNATDRSKSSPDASGIKNRPASSGFFFAQSKGNVMKTLQELRELRNQKAARQTELMELRKSEDRRFTSEEATEFDQLTEDVGNLDDDIRVKQFEATNAKAATTVHGKSSEEASRSRGGISFVRKNDPDEKFKGQAYTRMCIAKALAFMEMRSGNFITPGQIAEHRWGKSHPNLVNVIKAAVAGGGTGSGEWGAELAQSNNTFMGDFIEFLYSKTVFDRLPLTPVPARVHIKGQDGAATGFWVGESKGIGASAQDYSDVELTPLKVGAISVCSKELLADSDWSAEMLIRNSIVNASAQRVDTTFLGAAAASSGVSPAGLLNGISLLSPSGADAAAVRADYQALVQPFITAKNGGGLVHVMTPSMAMALGTLVNALGQEEFPDITEEGGTLFKRPVYTGDNVTAGNWLMLKPSDIWKIGDGGIELSMTDSATIEQDSAPAGAGDTPTAASATLMSLWQTDQVGFKVVRRINYAKRRSGAAVALQDAEYGGVVS